MPLNESMRILLLVALIASAGCRPPRVGNLPRQPVSDQGKEAAAEAPSGRQETAVTRQPLLVPPRRAVEAKPDPVPRDQASAASAANAALMDIYFGYDESHLDGDNLATLMRDAEILRPLLGEFAGLKVLVEGHCDERGSAEYNLGLGDMRAARALQALVGFGVPRDRIAGISYGKESPQCVEAAESCWSRNRRAHLAVR